MCHSLWTSPVGGKHFLAVIRYGRIICAMTLANASADGPVKYNGFIARQAAGNPPQHPKKIARSK